MAYMYAMEQFRGIIFTILHSRKFRDVGLAMLGFAVIVFTAMESVFFLYADNLKKLFHISHTKVELMSATFLMDSCFILPFTVVNEKFGFYGTNLVGFVTAGSGLLLTGLAGEYHVVFQQFPIVLTLLQFLISHGRSYLYYLSVHTTVALTPEPHRGKVIGVAVSLIVVGQILFEFLYEELFSHIEQFSYFFYFGFSLTGICITCYVTFYAATDPSVAKDEKKPMVPSANHSPDVESEQNGLEKERFNGFDKSSDNDNDTLLTMEPHKQMSFCEILRNKPFQLFLWSGAIVLCSSFIFMNNIIFVLQSVNQRRYSRLTMITNLTVTLVFRLLSGFLYDSLKWNCHRLLLLVSAAVCNVCSYVISATLADNIMAFLFSVAYNGVGMGLSLSVCMAHSAHILGFVNKSRVQSLLMSLTGIFLFGSSLQVGLSYDKLALQQNPTDNNFKCHGTMCYRLSFLLLASVNVIAICILCGLLYISTPQVSTQEKKCTWWPRLKKYSSEETGSRSD